MRSRPRACDRRSATPPDTPRPGSAAKRVDGARARPRSLSGVDDRAADRDARTSLRRRPTARRTSLLSEPSATAEIGTARGGPSVSVPVLSKATTVASRSDCSASPRRNRTAELGRAPCSDHDRGRRRQAHRAGAGDDQHRHGVDEREAAPALGRWRARPGRSGARRPDTAGTNQAVIGRPVPDRQALAPCAASTMRVMPRETSLSAPTFSVRTGR